MNPRPLVGLARRRWLRPLADFGLVAAPYLRVAFLGTGLRSGILRALADRPRTAAELGADLGYDPAMAAGLASWLDLGVQLGELRRDGDRYRVKGRRARSLVKPSNDPVAAFYEEYVQLDHRLVVETPERLAAGRPFELGDADAAIVARASRMAEPWLETAITAAVPAKGSVRLLEVGCGTGAHIRTACALNPALTATGLELQEGAAAVARRNVTAWGLADRVEVRVGDVRDVAGDASYDLATLHQNIYYFADAEKAALLRHVAGFLRPGGTLLVTTVVRGGGFGAAALDLWGAMTAGASRMPVTEELEGQLREAGLVDVASTSLGPDGLYRAFTGRRASG